MSARVSRPAETGVWIGIATITMTFAAFTSAMVVRQGASPDWRHFRLPPVLYFNTLLLVASSLTIERSRRRTDRALALGLPEPGLNWLYLTLGLGVSFVVGQLLAWRGLAAQGLFLSTNPSSAFFYVLTAAHAVHVLGGIAALSYVLYRLELGKGERPRSALRAAALYWHFMGVLWLYLLSILVFLL
jgi:cytochrome c oxidase subunit III